MTKDRTGLKKNGRINWMHPDNKKCVDLIGWDFRLSVLNVKQD
jgi:hypothetical protein